MGLVRANPRRNANAAKLLGGLTAILGVAALLDGIYAGGFLAATAGGIMLGLAGDELPQFSLRGIFVVVAYWFFLLLAISAAGLPG